MNVIGFLAATCVLASFAMQSMIALRAFAIASNLLFIVYGATSHLIPIVLLHALLLPINGWSLGRAWGDPILASKICLAMACWSGLLLGVALGSDLASASGRALDTIRMLIAQ